MGVASPSDLQLLISSASSISHEKTHENRSPFSRLFHLYHDSSSRRPESRKARKNGPDGVGVPLTRDPRTFDEGSPGSGSRGNSEYVVAGRWSSGSLIPRRNDGIGMRQTGALQEEIKGSRAGASGNDPRARWIR